METLEATVAIVDDKPTDVQSIVRNLDALAIGYRNFNASVGQDPRPKKPLEHIRIVFLDLYYDLSRGLTSQDLYPSVEWVDSIIPSGYHSYFLVLWTKDTDEVLQVLNLLHAIGKSPIGHLAAQKNHYQSGDNEYDVRRLFQDIPAGFLQIPKKVDIIEGQIIAVETDHVLINCRLEVDGKSMFQVRRFERGPLEVAVDLAENVFVQIEIATELGKRTVEFTQINEDISAKFVKEDHFIGFEDSPFRPNTDKK